MAARGRTAVASHPAVVLFLPDLAGGGAERVMLHVARLLEAHGRRVVLALGRNEGPLAPLVPEGIEVHELAPDTGVGVRFGLVCVRRLRKILSGLRPGVVLSTLVGGNVVAFAAARMAGTRVVLREANVYADMAGRPRSWLARAVYPRADALIAVAPPVADDLVRHCRVPRERVRVIPNPVDARAIREAAEGDRGPHACAGEVPTVVAAGRLVPVKGFASLVRAVGRLRRDRDVRLAILGEGPLRGELERLGRQELGDGVLLLPGWVPNPYRWYREAAAVVSTSRWEGCPNVLIEAAALGARTVAYRRRDTEWLASLGVPVELVPMGDEEALAAAVDRAMSEPRPTVCRPLPGIFEPEAVARRYAEALWG